jgi:hypothetical protein
VDEGGPPPGGASAKESNLLEWVLPPLASQYRKSLAGRRPPVTHGESLSSQIVCEVLQLGKSLERIFGHFSNATCVTPHKRRTLSCKIRQRKEFKEALKENVELSLGKSRNEENLIEAGGDLHCTRSNESQM